MDFSDFTTTITTTYTITNNNTNLRVLERKTLITINCT